MKLLSKVSVAIILTMQLWSNSLNALPGPRTHQCLAVVALLTGGLGVGATLLAWGITEGSEVQKYLGGCFLTLTIMGGVFMTCVPVHNWYGHE